MLQAVRFNQAVKGVVLERTSGSFCRLTKYFVNGFGTYVSKIICEELDLINYDVNEETKEERASRIEKLVRSKVPNLPKKIYVDSDVL